MTEPSQSECDIAKKVFQALCESGKTSSSYYVSTEELVKKCERYEVDPTVPSGSFSQ